MENQAYTYDAFISYRHRPLDARIAGELQKLLEAYKPPKGARCSKRKISRVFLDTTELPNTSSLTRGIETALGASQYLIVICSRETQLSKWCMQEIAYFKALHGGSCDRILTVLVDGEPHEAFPPLLREEVRVTTDSDGRQRTEAVEIEPLATDVRAQKTGKIAEAVRRLRRYEFLRIAAPLLGCGYDMLYERHRRNIRKYRLRIAAALLLALLAGLAYWFYNQALVRRSDEEARAQAHLAQQREIAQTIQQAEALVGAQDRVLASALLLDLSERHALSPQQQREVETLLYASTYVPRYGCYTFVRHPGEILSGAFTPDGEQLFFASSQGVISHWDARNGALVRQIDLRQGIHGIRATAQSLYIVTEDAEVFGWDFLNGAAEAEPVSTRQLDDVPDGTVEAVLHHASYDKNTHEDHHTLFLVMDGIAYQAEGTAYNERSDAIVNAVWDEEMVWMDYMVTRLGTGEAYRFSGEWPVSYNNGYGQFIMFEETMDEQGFTNFEYLITLYDVADGKEVGSFSAEEHPRAYDRRVYSYSPDGKYAAISGFKGELQILNFESRGTEVCATVSDSEFRQLHFLDDQTLLALEAGNQNARLIRYGVPYLYFDVGDPMVAFLPGSGAYTAGVVSPEGSRMALYDTHGNVALYALTDTQAGGQPARTLPADALVALRDGVFDRMADDGGSYLRHASAAGEADTIVDASTGEALFPLAAPSSYLSIDLKSTEHASLLNEAGSLVDFNPQTGEVLRTLAIQSPFSILEYGTWHSVDHTEGIVLVRAHLPDMGPFEYVRGGAFDLQTGALLFEFSEPFERLDYLFSADEKTIYRYDHNDMSAGGIAIAVPRRDELVALAAGQVMGREITDEERSRIDVAIGQ